MAALGGKNEPVPTTFGVFRMQKVTNSIKNVETLQSNGMQFFRRTAYRGPALLQSRTTLFPPSFCILTRSSTLLLYLVVQGRLYSLEPTAKPPNFSHRHPQCYPAHGIKLNFFSKHLVHPQIVPSSKIWWISEQRSQLLFTLCDMFWETVNPTKLLSTVLSFPPMSPLLQRSYFSCFISFVSETPKAVPSHPRLTPLHVATHPAKKQNISAAIKHGQPAFRKYAPIAANQKHTFFHHFEFREYLHMLECSLAKSRIVNAPPYMATSARIT